MNKARKFAKKVRRSTIGRITIMAATILTQMATAILITALISGIIGHIIAAVYFICSVSLVDEDLTAWLEEDQAA